MLTRARTLVLVLLAYGWAAAFAAEQQAESPFIIEVWGTQNRQPHKRLPQSSVIAITQTRDGYLWLGTLNGLVRFDGSRFTVFDEGNTPGLPSSRVVSLFEDSRGWLWVGTEVGGVAVIRNGKVTSLGVGQGASEGRLMSACEDSDGAVWLYTADGRLWRFQDDKLTANVIGDGRPGGCRSVIFERGGPVWVGTDWGQMALEQPARTNPARFQVIGELPAGKLDFLLASARGGYWRLADNRIEKWDGARCERLLGPYPWADIPGARITCACEDADGHLIVGTLNAGVYSFDETGAVTHIGRAEGLSHLGVLSVCVDREGCLWVGTDGGGLNRVKRRVGEVLPGTRSWVVQTACEDAEGGLWVGSNGSGVAHASDGRFDQYGMTNGLLSPNVWSVFADRSRHVWVGTRGPGGLYQFNAGQFGLVPVAGAFGLDVFALHQDRSGRLWVGMPNGVGCLSGNSWQLFTTRDGLSADVVRAVADDAEGNVWIGTVGGGLNRLRDGRFTSYRKSAETLPGDNISALLVDADGTLWVGTGSGLARYRDGRWTRYTTREGLASDSITSLVEDGEGYLWAGSNFGLMRLPKRALNDFAEGRAATVSCRVYDEADGLPTGECTSGSQPGALRTRAGKLWFPTIAGLVGVDPAHLKLNTNPPPVAIESVLVNGREQLTNGLRAPLPAMVQVPPGAERLEIQFTSMNLAASDRALFRCRLEGHETTWTEIREPRVARYSKLPPGRYRFHVTACNEDGLWNETGSALSITVLPPFWRAWWFLTLAFLSLLGAIVATVHMISTQRLQRQLVLMRQKEALERERSRIARDLHDQLGANLTRVSLLGELVESDKDQPSEVEAHARQISRTATETAHALDEIVWAANPANDTLEGLVNYICKYAQEFLATAGVRCRLEVPAQLPVTSIAPDFRHNIFLVAKETVNNVVKHAQASSARVRLAIESDRLVLEIEDDGRGIDGTGTQGANGRNGLRNMSRRMEDVGGTFYIGPGAGRGTLVRLTAPLNRI
jgi:signal transduction histidine kinase/ligand-binding sensor domain-containing protein